MITLLAPAINVGLGREEGAQLANVVLKELRQPLIDAEAGGYRIITLLDDLVVLEHQ